MPQLLVALRLLLGRLFEHAIIPLLDPAQHISVDALVSHQVHVGGGAILVHPQPP